jgi:hypothetical protein
MHAKYLFSAALLSASLAAATAPAALASSANPRAVTSANWSGYVAQSKSGDGFSSVSGSWVEPPTNCSASEGHASFWVGLGGSGQSSQSLEQVGTARIAMPVAAPITTPGTSWCPRLLCD